MKTILGYKQNFCIHLLCLSLSMVKGWKDGGGGGGGGCVCGGVFGDAQKLVYGAI